MMHKHVIQYKLNVSFVKPIIVLPTLKNNSCTGSTFPLRVSVR